KEITRMDNLEGTESSAQSSCQVFLGGGIGTSLALAVDWVFAEEGAFPILQSLGQFPIEAHEDSIQLDGRNIQDQDLNATLAMAGQLRRRDLLKVCRERLEGERGGRELYSRRRNSGRPCDRYNRPIVRLG